jgi:cytochrome c oxidase subunit 1/cytochrome c oxidase subunit I+III
MTLLKPEAVLDLSEIPASVLDHRALVWWGNALMLVIEGTVLALLGVATLYLRMRTHTWPPPGMPLPDLGFPTATLAVLLASVVPMRLADLAALRGEAERVRLWTWVTVAFGLGFLALRAYEFGNLQVRWSDHAYGSSLWTILGMHTAHMLAVTVEMIFLGVVLTVRHVDRKHRLDLRVNASYWYFVVLVWLPFHVLLHVLPRVRP